MKIIRSTKQQISTVKEKINQVTDHIRENKVAYLTGGACFIGGLLLANKSVKVDSHVTVINMPSVPQPKTDANGVMRFDTEEQKNQFLEHYYPLSMARHRRIQEQMGRAENTP